VLVVNGEQLVSPKYAYGSPIAQRCGVSLFAQGANRATSRNKQSKKEKRLMRTLVARFVREDAGQDLIEYGLLIGIITAAAITAIGAIGPKVQQYYVSLNSKLP